MVWSASDNDLYECCINDVDKMERGLPNDIAVLANVDHGPRPDAPGGMQRLVLHKNQEGGLQSPVVKDFGAGDTASPKNLADFVKWGIKNYPAENYWLVISDHGDSWKGACRDDSHGTWMSLPQIQSALYEARQASGEKLDLVSFDCCHMASSEVAHQLKDEARYLVGSQEIMGYIGLPYERLLPKIGQKDARQVAELLVQESRDNPEDIPTFSALDLSQVPAYSSALKRLGEGVLRSAASQAELRQAVERAQSFDSGYYRDAVDLAKQFAEVDPKLATAAEQVRESASRLVIASQAADTHPQANGVQIEVFQDSEASRQAAYAFGSPKDLRQGPLRTESGSYAETAFAREVGWDRVIARLDLQPPLET
jgi:hypothetical protein